MAQNSVSTCWRGEHSKRDEKWILVCAYNDKDEDKLGNVSTIHHGWGYQLAEFHMVDLENNKIHRHCFPPLLQFVLMDSVVALDNFIYIFGNRPSKYLVDSSDFKQLQSQSPETHQKIFLGGSRLDLDQSLHLGWCPTPVPSGKANFPNCTSLLGKIYTFGGLYLRPLSLCSLPDELVDCTVSIHALPDPSNKRFLVHLYGGQLSSPSLFAFFPPGLHPADVDTTRTWECIARDFHGWTHIAVVFDVHWGSCFDGNLDLNNIRLEFDALFLLADGILCLAAWSPMHASDDQPARTNIKIYKFSVVQSGETIKLSPLASRSYELLATSSVQGFLSV
ncbi:hypothetical protein RND81_05G131700 [Saponaria officinalis]|uniref:Uncharacterized protein n=1 Tax=Saponaria officinalis TaxID=3572 RepID=A0AAW1KXM3_SAPOF